jgi:Fe-S-cluster containining protein
MWPNNEITETACQKLYDEAIFEQGFIRTAQEFPIVWHKTTPVNFKCQLGCMSCCRNPFYTIKEAQKLPRYIQERLIINHQRYKRITPLPKVREDVSTCEFFREVEGDCCQCAIHDHAPLMCKIFPYFPVVDNLRGIIMVFCNPFLTFEHERGIPKKVYERERCFGLGKGPKIQRQFNKVFREYLEAVAKSRDKVLLSEHFFVDSEGLASHLNPMLLELYKKHMEF